MRAKYAGSRGLNPRNHWSGESKKTVREAAFAYVKEHGPDFAGDMTSLVKGRIFDALASPVTHADPAGTLFVPKDDKGWLRTTPHEPSWNHAITLYVVALMLFWLVAQRASPFRDKAERLWRDAQEELLKER